MSMEWSATTGFLAGALTSFGFVPQIVRVYRLKSARDLSLSFTLLFLSGVGLWFLYGIVEQLWPIVVWNALTFLLVLFLVIAKMRYGQGKGPLP
ncbi:MAG: SemiSWEET transporter [Chloroflexi bacterium]|nr:SemiSWEET transporter [Chloroflexota bacterium]